MRPDAMRKLRRTELATRSENHTRFQILRACHASVRAIRVASIRTSAHPTLLPQAGSWRWRAASVNAPLLDGNELRPVLHLHARHEPILAVLGLENRCFAFLHIEPVLAQGIDDVGLVRDEEGVFALFWHLRQHPAKCRGSPAIFVG